MARILVVDDSASMRIKMRSVLMVSGHTVVCEAENGSEAFIQYEKHLPDLVLMDVMVTANDSTSAVRKIMSAFPDARIVMVGSPTQKHMVFLALQRGARHYIFKPLDTCNVESVISMVLSGEYSCKSNYRCTEGFNLIRTLSRDRPDYQPFLLEKLDGVYVINISEKINKGNIKFLNYAVRRSLSENPSNIVLNFGDLEYLDTALMEDISTIINLIRRLYGNIRVVSHNKSFVRFFRERSGDVLKHVYSNLSEALAQPVQ